MVCYLNEFNSFIDFRDKDVVLLPLELGGEEAVANVAALLTLKDQEMATEKDEAG